MFHLLLDQLHINLRESRFSIVSHLQQKENYILFWIYKSRYFEIYHLSISLTKWSMAMDGLLYMSIYNIRSENSQKYKKWSSLINWTHIYILVWLLPNRCPYTQIGVQLGWVCCIRVHMYILWKDAIFYMCYFSVVASLSELASAIGSIQFLLYYYFVRTTFATQWNNVCHIFLRAGEVTVLPFWN